MKTNPETITLMVVEDHFVFRAGLRAIFSLRANFQVVAEAGTLEEAVTLYRKHQSAVTLMDLRLPGRNGIEAIRAIRAEWPKARILMLTTFDGDEDIHSAMEAGACGYLLKSVPGEELLRAVDAAAHGQSYMPPEVALRLAERAAYGVLTEREREVLPLVAKGLTNREIAEQLKFTEFTAKAHVRSLMAKLGAADRTEAATLAIQRGFIHLS